MNNTPRRRPEDCIGKMLRSIYGDVHHRYRIQLGTHPKDYEGQSIHSSLFSIYSALKNHRGFTNFVKANYVDVDFFIPNPGFIVECDESQHFTEPRKISLQNYPEDKKIGYSKKDWIAHCKNLNKSDKYPPSRDEQRAWYDTIRDFLPEIKGFQPTVRLYTGERDWCRMDPSNATDIQNFKNHIDKKRGIELRNKGNNKINPKENWVATVTLEANSRKEPKSNPERINDLKIIVTKILEETDGDGIVVFPAGFLSTGSDEIKCPFYSEISRAIQNALPDNERNIAIVVGIDGYEDAQKNARDQVAITINKTDILSIARKHWPTEDDKKFGLKKSDFSDSECGKARFFTVNGIRYYIAVCYDVHAGHQDGIKKDDAAFDVILNPIHKFEAGSGIADFVRKGMGLESCMWDCPVFGSVKFINGSTISEIWKSGVYWAFPDGVTTRTPGTNTEKFSIPGKKIPVKNLSGGDQAVVDIFTDIRSQCSTMRENLRGFLENQSGRYQKNHVSTMKLDTYDPKFATVIYTYKQMAGPYFKKGGTSSKENYIVKIRQTPPGVLYYFCHFPNEKKFSIELTVNKTRAPQFESAIRDLYTGNHFVGLPKAELWEQGIKDGILFRLQFFYPEDTPPQTVVEGMFDLIEQSFGSFERNDIEGLH